MDGPSSDERDDDTDSPSQDKHPSSSPHAEPSSSPAVSSPSILKRRASGHTSSPKSVLFAVPEHEVKEIKGIQDWMFQRPHFTGDEEPYESFRLNEGEPHLTIQRHHEIPRMLIITLHKEDYTLAGMLVNALREDERVEFAGYKVMHPLEPKVDLYLTTRDGVDERRVVKEVALGLVRAFEELRLNLVKEFQLHKVVADEKRQAEGIKDESTKYGSTKDESNKLNEDGTLERE